MHLLGLGKVFSCNLRAKFRTKLCLVLYVQTDDSIVPRMCHKLVPLNIALNKFVLQPPPHIWTGLTCVSVIQNVKFPHPLTSKYIPTPM